MEQRIKDLELALEYALVVLEKFEPGDSRAVSNEFVAMAAILCDCSNDECITILEKGIECQSIKH